VLVVVVIMDGTEEDDKETSRGEGDDKCEREQAAPYQQTLCFHCISNHI